MTFSTLISSVISVIYPAFGQSSSKRVDLSFHDCLPPDEAEARRLKLQHDIISRGLGNVLIHVPVDLGAPNTAILDSCSGTGSWLLDVAKTVPETTELIGIDVSSKLFPLEPGLPRNLSFRVTSVLELPQEWDNKFSLVHQRLLHVALNRSQWVDALKSIYRVLKPGAWVQLGEVDKWTKSGTNLRLFTTLWKSMLEARGIHGSWPHGSKMWKKEVEEAGFVDIHVRWFETPVGSWAGQDGIDMREDLVGLMRSLRPAAIKHNNFGAIKGGERGYDKWMKNVEKEVDEGATEPKVRWVMICARKPTTL